MNTLKEILSEVTRCVENTDAKQISGSACGGIVITLHNDGGRRPTRYHVSYNFDRRTYCLDTLTNENKEHECLKVQYSTSEAHKQECIGTIKRLFAQECKGTEAETSKAYTSIGLLWAKGA
jgi:hypothetical protein